MRLFDDDGDYSAFGRVLEETAVRMPDVRVVTYCTMPNHWHLLLWPRRDGALSEFMRLLTVTHTHRWHAHHQTAGTGPIYQGRFKSFPIQRDAHLLTVARYAERNPVRAKLVKAASAWPWGAAAQRTGGKAPAWLLPLSKWPAEPPSGWAAWVDRPETAAEREAIEAVRTSVRRGRPYGDPRWQGRTARRLGLETTFADRGRPRVKEAAK